MARANLNVIRRPTGESVSLTIQTTIDMRPILAMVNTFERGLDQATRLAQQRIGIAIRNEVLDTFVRNICASAGPGWPEVYTDHLVAVLRATAGAQAEFGAFSDGNIRVIYDFDALGDYNDFEKGAHHQALLSFGGEENHPAGSSGSGHHGRNPHPARVRLPYGGDPLMNSDERRQEFWERVVLDRDFGFQLLMRRGKEGWTLSDHMQRFGYDIATFDEIAMARVLAWGPRAPEWLILENGSDSIMHGSRPVVRPTHFMTLLATAMGCVMEHIFEGAMLTLVELAENAGVAVGSSGIPFSRESGQFAAYKELLDIKVGDYTPCFGKI